jgi:hypothetical protein
MNVMEPTQFGWQQVGEINFYLPSPESIRTECERIQRGWTPSERDKRRTSMPRDNPSIYRGRERVELPFYSMALQR